MKKLLLGGLHLYIVSALLFFSNGALAQWSFLGPSDQNRPNPSPTQHVSADCDKNGVVYVASMTTFEGFPRIPLIRKYQNGLWTTSLQLEENRATNMTIVVNKFDNIPYVLFKDLFNGSRATLLKYDGATWNPVGVPGFSLNAVDSLLLSFDSQGNPYVTYENHDNNKSASMMEFKNGTWNMISSDLTPSFSTILQFKLDKADIPYILYAENSTDYIISYKSGHWSFLGNDFIEPGARGAYFDIDDNNEIYITYKNATADVVVKKLSGGTWNLLESPGLKYYTDLDISLMNNIPFLKSTTSTDTHIYYYSGGHWNKTIANIPFATDFDDFTMFAYSPDKFFISYSNHSLMNNGAGDITVQEYSLLNTKWSIVGSGGIGNGEIADVDFELDRFSIPYLVSHDNITGIVNVREFINNNWISVGDGFNTHPYSFCKIKFDNENKPLIIAGSYGGTVNDISSFTFLNGKWQTLSYVNTGFTDSYSTSKPLTIDKDGHFIFGLIDNVSGKLSVMKYLNNKWDYLGNPFFSNKCRYYTIAVGNDNNPIVVMENNDNQNFINAFILDGNNWVDMSNGIPKISGYSPTISIDNYGTPYMAFSDDFGKVYILKYQNNVWVPVGNTSAIDIVNVYDKFIQFDSFNTPYICFEGGFQYKISVARLKDNNWIFLGNQDISAPEIKMGGMKIFSNNLYVGYRAYSPYVQKYDISAILALTFMEFTIKEQNKNVLLNWKVNMPEDCLYYTIQKSDNGLDFTDIGNVNSTNLQEYSYTDLNAKKGIKYYKIKATTKSQENINSIVCKTGLLENKGTITIAPNPIVNNSINLVFENNTVGKYSFSLINLSGETIYKSEKYLELNANLILDLGGNNKKGLYILKILDPSGYLVYKKVIVK